jgi:dimeric dUTPase (all-alpha-NTP-PPase superfamily)
MENQKQCNCCSCRCDKLEKELAEQREIVHRYRDIAQYIKQNVKEDIRSVHNDIVRSMKTLNASLYDMEDLTEELEGKSII